MWTQLLDFFGPERGGFTIKFQLLKGKIKKKMKCKKK